MEKIQKKTLKWKKIYLKKKQILKVIQKKNSNDNQIIGIEKLKLKINSPNYYLYDKLNDLPFK